MLCYGMLHCHLRNMGFVNAHLLERLRSSPNLDLDNRLSAVASQRLRSPW